MIERIKALDIPLKMKAPDSDTVHCHMCAHYGNNEGEAPDICIKHNMEILADNKICVDFNPNSEHLPIRRQYNNTDLGNAEYLIDTNDDDLRFCSSWEKWVIWNGNIWKLDDNLEIMRKAHTSIRLMYGDAGNITDRKEREERVKHALTCESNTKLNAMVNIARALVPISHDSLDSNNYLLCVKNGIIDLKTGKLSPHSKYLFITKMADVVFNKDADCPEFKNFLNLIFNNNEELIRFVQKALGYSLTGDTGEQVLLILWGSGNNGKSTLINLINKILVLGNYADRIQSESIMQKDQNDDKRNDLAALKGVRFLSCSEGDEGRYLNESLVKDVTGCDYIKTRFLYQEYFTYKPIFKLWYATNHKPIIRGTDPAIWRRIMLIEFKVNVPDALKKQNKDRIPNYEDVLYEKESSGILNWLIEGCLAWGREGLNPPKCVLESNSNYKNDMDLIQSFIDECCIVDKNKVILFSILYNCYKQWCDINGDKALSTKKFAMRLEEKGFDKDKGPGNVKIRKGIFLKDNIIQDYDLPINDRLPIVTDKRVTFGATSYMVNSPERVSQSVIGNNDRLNDQSQTDNMKYSSDDDQKTRHIKIRLLIRDMIKANSENMPVFKDMATKKEWILSKINENTSKYCQPNLKINVLSEDIKDVLEAHI